MNRIEIYRKSDNRVQTIGEGQVVNELGGVLFQFKTLELPWKDNERRVSCIPPGTYEIIKHTSPKFGECWWLQDVPGRSEILIHAANYVRQLRGCIAPGLTCADIDGDGNLDVTSSRIAMTKLLEFDFDKIEIVGSI